MVPGCFPGPIRPAEAGAANSGLVTLSFKAASPGSLFFRIYRFPMQGPALPYSCGIDIFPIP